MKIRLRTMLGTMLVFTSMALELPEDPGVSAGVLIEKETCGFIPTPRTTYQQWYVGTFCPKPN